MYVRKMANVCNLFWDEMQKIMKKYEKVSIVEYYLQNLGGEYMYIF